MCPMSDGSTSCSGGRPYDLIERLIAPLDQAARTLFGAPHATRPNPAEGIPESVEKPEERSHAAALLRVNHAGEIAAQALYQGQALTATNETTKQSLQIAAREESDNLSWCAERIEELGGRTSLLNQLRYEGLFTIDDLGGLG